MAWKFADAPTTGVFTSKRILSGDEWVYYATHDSDDGAWQFHPASGPTSEEEAAVVSLGSMVTLDASLESLADLPLGWHAWRESENSAWQRASKEDD